jgi:hypothetical protein
VKLESYIIEGVILQKKLLSNLVLVVPNLLQNPDTVSARKSHNCQEAAKTCPQSKTRTQQEPL